MKVPNKTKKRSKNKENKMKKKMRIALVVIIVLIIIGSVAYRVFDQYPKYGGRIGDGACGLWEKEEYAGPDCGNGVEEIHTPETTAEAE